jgi:hypothetical protein
MFLPSQHATYLHVCALGQLPTRISDYAETSIAVRREGIYVLTALLLLPGIKADVARCLKRTGALLDSGLQAGVPVTCHGGSPPHSSVSCYLRPRQGTAHP